MLRSSIRGGGTVVDLEGLMMILGLHRQGLSVTAIAFRDEPPTGRLGALRSPLDPAVQIPEPRLQIRLVVPPRHPVHAGSRPALQREEGRPEQIDVDVVEKRGEPFRPVLPCGLSYAVEPP